MIQCLLESHVLCETWPNGLAISPYNGQQTFNDRQHSDFANMPVFIGAPWIEIEAKAKGTGDRAFTVRWRNV